MHRSKNLLFQPLYEHEWRKKIYFEVYPTHWWSICNDETFKWSIQFCNLLDIKITKYFDNIISTNLCPNPHSTVILREYFKNIPLKSCNTYCKNIYKAVRKVSKILQEPCNGRSKHYKSNVAAILILHF